MAIENMQFKEHTILDEDLRLVRSLTDFDLRMLLAEINDCGWKIAKRTLPLMATSSIFERAKEEGKITEWKEGNC